MTPDDLVAFLFARLDEEAEIANRENTWPSGGAKTAADWNHVAGEADSMLVATFSPARVLAEVEAKRKIIALAADAWRHYQEELDFDGSRKYSDGGYEDFRAAWEIWERTLLIMASVYADHADYDPSWKPDSG